MILLKHLLFLLFYFCIIEKTQAQAYLKGDTLFGKKAYFKAIDYYKQELLFQKDSNIICHSKKQLAECYSLLNDIENAETTYRDLLKSCKTEVKEIRNLGRILQKKGEYEKARKIYSSCFLADSNDKFSYVNMHFLDTASHALDRITDIYLEPITEINSSFDEMLFEANNDTLFFLSARKTKPIDRKLTSNNQYPYRIFYWHPSLHKPLLSSATTHNFITYDFDKEDAFYTRTLPLLKDSTKSRMVIFRKRKGDPFGSKFFFDDDSSHFGHPSISIDGNLFFFVSNKPGGYGGMDIYVCRKSGNKWSPPTNLGPTVNTPYNELLPFYIGEGIILFSSDGHETFGGFDIYASTFRNNQWDKPIHLSLPINSRGDDLGFRWDRTKKTFYLSSNRTKGKGSLDLYRIRNFDVEDLKRWH